MIGDHQYCITQNNFIALQIPCAPLILTFLSFSQTLGNHWCFFVFCFYNFAFSKCRNWNHIVHSLSDCFLSLSSMHLFSLYLLVFQQQIPFNDCIIFHCVDIPQFIHSPVEKHFSCFQVSAIMNKVALKIMYKFYIDVSFPFIQIKISRSMMVDSYFKSLFSFARDCQSFF